MSVKAGLLLGRRRAAARRAQGRRSPPFKKPFPDLGAQARAAASVARAARLKPDMGVGEHPAARRRRRSAQPPIAHPSCAGCAPRSATMRRLAGPGSGRLCVGAPTSSSQRTGGEAPRTPSRPWPCCASLDATTATSRVLPPARLHRTGRGSRPAPGSGQARRPGVAVASSRTSARAAGDRPAEGCGAGLPAPAGAVVDGDRHQACERTATLRSLLLACA